MQAIESAYKDFVAFVEILSHVRLTPWVQVPHSDRNTTANLAVVVERLQSWLPCPTRWRASLGQVGVTIRSVATDWSPRRFELLQTTARFEVSLWSTSLLLRGS